ncbi:hypothetical protein [Nocardia huaxiensis]|uniref:SH3 domain-containing protein n=1 Tax=Nocardia huaxiensis TaxID=2755382 RepID=A0A7D6VGG3_9NOCA|nr:hypothetical protein [Nocardia huaxiensis]QLY32257.1 hypothetical protein H0264_08315 [Nocardia huaxiensis]UFS94040.1 hypothetical protein LPY97_25105 [Nocardia huaxiensis]
MIKKTFAVAAVAAGAVLALAPLAGADPADPAKFSDVTAQFVPYNDLNVLQAKDQGKLIIVSPYGTGRTIACRGNGADVAYYDCMQNDSLGWIKLNQTELPALGKAWVYTGETDPNA